MKLNNKGFAITAVLYGLLILFVFFVSAYLLALSAKKNSIDSLIENIENEYKGNELLIDHIKDLYNKEEKTTITHNSIQYNISSSQSLINDRLGGITADYNAGNIRYYGANPNNYLDLGDTYSEEFRINLWNDKLLLLGETKEIATQQECYDYFSYSNLKEIGYCSDDDSCQYILSLLLALLEVSSVEEVCKIEVYNAGDPILYRIIGVMKNVILEDGTTTDLVKVVRDASIGSYTWDLKEGGVTSNYWPTSSMNELLNTAFYNKIAIEYYNDNTSLDSKVTLNFSNTGLSQKAREKIEKVKWQYIDINETTIVSPIAAPLLVTGFPNVLYTYEVSSKVTDGYVGLIYPSDHGYSANLGLSQCELPRALYGEDYRICLKNNWMVSSGIKWTMTSNNGYAELEGKSNKNVIAIENNSMTFFTPDKKGVIKPAMYLDTKLLIKSGNGSKSSPYKVDF